jgi:type IV pilus assembly protein PilM
MAKKATAVDLGSHSSKVLVAEAGKHGIKVLRFAGLPHGEGGNAVSLQQAGIALGSSIVGLAGRDMTLRYSQVPPTPDWQLRNLMELEIQDLAQQSGGALSADFNLLPSQDAEAQVDTVLLALAKDEALDRLQGDVRSGGGSVAAFVPNCTALYNAYLKCGPVEADSVACLVHIGHQTIDLAIVKGTDLLFARNLGSGAKVLDDAIAASFNVGERKAEALKKDLLDLDPQSRGRYASGQAEKVTLSATSAAGSISAAIQSSLAFCKSQTKIADLRLDRVLLSGGGARLRGIRGFLREVLRCPVELFDPFANLDLSALPPADAEQLAAMRHEAVVALGLAVGRLDDTLYSLEILPEAVRKAQRFKQRTIWNVLAGALVLAALVLQWQHGTKKAAAAEIARTRINRAVAQVNSVHTEAQGLVDQNRELRSVVEHLSATALPLQGMLRVQRAVQQHLPPQFWIEKFEVQGGGSSAQKKKPAVVVEAAGKELNGVAPSRLWLEFMQKLRTDPGMADLTAQMSELQKTDSAERWRVTIELLPEVK